MTTEINSCPISDVSGKDETSEVSGLCLTSGPSYAGVRLMANANSDMVKRSMYRYWKSDRLLSIE